MELPHVAYFLGDEPAFVDDRTLPEESVSISKTSKCRSSVLVGMRHKPYQDDTTPG